MLCTTLIDDFGLKPLRAPADEDLHDLIAERYEQAATIVTSNLDFTEWDQAFPGNRLLASATVDRLRHNAYCLTLDGASYRALRQEPNKAKTALASTPKTTNLEPPKTFVRAYSNWLLYADHRWLYCAGQ